MMMSMTTSPSRFPRTKGVAALAALGAATALLMAGCASPGPGAGQDGTSAPASASAETTAPAATAPADVPAEPLTVADPWVKAVEQDEMMTAVFASLTNTTDQELRIVGARTPIAEKVELHETVEDGTGATVMQEKEGGFIVPAGGTLTLDPGGDHLMPMGLTGSITPGQEVELTVEFADGRTQTLTATAKEFAGAQENYGGTGEMDHDGHEGHGDHGEHGEEGAGASESAGHDGH